MNFKHYLLTRFNIGLYDKKQKVRNGNKIDPEQWMESRTALFEKYCSPSINNQTNKNFTWLIVFDPATPQETIIDIIINTGALALMGDNFRSTCINYIEKDLDGESVIITSRMDNDDALHKNFISHVQDWYKIRKRTGVVTFPKGWIYHHQKGKLFHVRYNNNPFLTLIEKRGPKDVKTILAHRHTKVVNMFHLWKIETDAHMWTQVIHGENLANYCRGDRSNMSQFTPGDYGLL